VTDSNRSDQANDAAPAAGPVFISYASADTAVAAALVEVLERHGIACWIAPRDVKAGALYADAIVRAISGARALVLVMSASAIASSHVGKEIERASSKKRPIIALRIDAAALTPALEYFLSESQWVEARAGKLEAACAKLIEAINEPERMAPRAAATASAIHPKSHRNWILFAAGLAFVAVVLAILLADKFRLARHATAAAPSAAAGSAVSDKSVAVLPFVDMSEKKDQEYFSDGLSEELIDHLAHNSNLKVISRTSSFQFKGKNEDVRTIGQRLGVANLVEGSVRTSGKTMRVTAQLIRVSDGSHLWSQAYDRNMGDIFKVQDSIATAVVAAMQATLAQLPSLPQERSESIAAYNALLRARYFDNIGTKQDSDRAVAAFEEAIRLDPQYATAWAALARTYNKRGLASWMPPKEAYAEARKAVDQALAIEPNLADAHRMLGTLEWNYQRDFQASAAEFVRARELDPNNRPAILHDEGITALAYGQLDQGVRLLQELTEIDPLDQWALWVLTFGLSAADRLPEAEHAARSLVELKPDAGDVHCALGEVLLAEHKTDEALAVMSEETDPDLRWCMTDALWALGHRAESDTLLVQAARMYADSQAMQIAQSYALRSDKDEAFKWLERAYDNREPPVTLIKADRSLRSLHGDPRFPALLAKLKLPQ
jgi:TolB-like protein